MNNTNREVTYFIIGLIALIIGCFLGICFTSTVWADACLENNIGYYDSKTGNFELRKFEVVE